MAICHGVKYLIQTKSRLSLQYFFSTVCLPFAPSLSLSLAITLYRAVVLYRIFFLFSEAFSAKRLRANEKRNLLYSVLAYDILSATFPFDVSHRAVILSILHRTSRVYILFVT